MSRCPMDLNNLGLNRYFIKYEYVIQMIAQERNNLKIYWLGLYLCIHDIKLTLRNENCQL